MYDEIKPSKVRIPDNGLLLLKSLCTSSNLDLVFIIAARKVEGLYDNVSVERAVDRIIGKKLVFSGEVFVVIKTFVALTLEATVGGRNNNNGADDSLETRLLEESKNDTWNGIIKK